MTFTIRLTRPVDIKALQAVEISASKAFAAFPGLEDFADDSCASEEQHLPTIKAQTSWLAETGDGTPVGFLAAFAEDHALHIYEISVHFDHQGKGIGRALMARAEACALAQNLDALTLTTFSHVPFNAPFYETLGFEIQSDETCEKRLLALLDKERSAGFPMPEKRCAMRKALV